MINAEILNAAGINYDAGMKRFLHDAELYEAVLTAFAQEDSLEKAQTAFAAEDMPALLRAAHTAKGSGGNAGLDQVYAEAIVLVKLLRSETYTQEAISHAFRRFEAAYINTRDAISQALGFA